MGGHSTVGLRGCFQHQDAGWSDWERERSGRGTVNTEKVKIDYCTSFSVYYEAVGMTVVLSSLFPICWHPCFHRPLKHKGECKNVVTSSTTGWVWTVWSPRKDWNKLKIVQRAKVAGRHWRRMLSVSNISERSSIDSKEMWFMSQGNPESVTPRIVPPVKWFSRQADWNSSRLRLENWFSSQCFSFRWSIEYYKSFIAWH